MNWYYFYLLFFHLMILNPILHLFAMEMLILLVWMRMN